MMVRFANVFVAGVALGSATRHFFDGDVSRATMLAAVGVSSILISILVAELEKSSKSVDSDGKGENYDEWA